MELRTADVRLNYIKSLTRKEIYSNTEDILYDLPSSWFDEWTIGETYETGRCVVRGGIKYLVLEPIVANNFLYPETITSRYVYEPYQGSENTYNWAYGERVNIGFKRTYEDVVYTPIVDISKEENIITPDVSDKWEKYPPIIESDIELDSFI